MRISYSAINTYKTCPLKYKFQYIEKIKEPKSKEAVFGTLIHSTLKFIHTPALLVPTLEQSLDHFGRNWNTEIWESEIEERSAFSQAVNMIRNYYEKTDIVGTNIVDLESHFNIDLDGNVISGIIDRIDKTADGYEIIDYKTAKKMPPQERIDNDLQLTVYLQAFLNRYPEEIKNLDKLKVSLYFLKHGVKLSATRSKEQLENMKEAFLETIQEIEKSKFDPNVSPLCDWCGFQDRCPMWKHKFKEKRKINSEEINKAIADYIENKNKSAEIRYKMAELQKKISQYMDQEGVERVFGESGVIARTTRQTYKFDEKKLKEILTPLGKWDEVVKVNAVNLKKVAGTLPIKIKKEIESAKLIDKETKSFSVKKQATAEEE